MSKSTKVLLAHSERIARQTLARDLAQKGHQVRSTDKYDTLWRWVRDHDGDLVLLDVDISDPARNGFELLQQIKKYRADLPVLVLSAENTVLTSLLAARFGAFDYFPKPFSFEQLGFSIARALRAPETLRKPDRSRLKLPLIGRSDVMQQVYRHIARAAQSNLPVLITGETGTGKSKVAQILHDYGNHAKSALKRICPPVAANEFENVITESVENHSNGTVVLDEIGAFTQGQQARLVQVLDTLENNNKAPRFIATSRQTLKDGTGLENVSLELFYRLNIVHIHLPPLRDRMDDVIELARGFTANVSDGQQTLGKSAERALVNRYWPGNVRELKNTIQRAVMMAQSHIIEANDFHIPKEVGNQGDANAFENAIAKALEQYLQKFDADAWPPELYQHALEAMEPPLLKTALSCANGNQIKAAKLLGINRNTLHKKLVKYDLLAINTT